MTVETGYKNEKATEVKKERWFTTITTDSLKIPIKLSWKKSSKFLCFFRAMAVPKMRDSHLDKHTVLSTLRIRWQSVCMGARNSNINTMERELS